MRADNDDGNRKWVASDYVMMAVGAIYAVIALSAATVLVATILLLVAFSAKSEERGVASWYGGSFNGRPTASGETYDQDARTCAHRTLPFGTIVHVFNHDNGRSTSCRVNDRGPFVAGRIIDLSRRVTGEIGLVESGTGRVTIRRQR